MPRLSMDAQQAWTRLAFQCNSKADGSPQVVVGVGGWGAAANPWALNRTRLGNGEGVHSAQMDRLLSPWKSHHTFS